MPAATENEEQFKVEQGRKLLQWESNRRRAKSTVRLEVRLSLSLLAVHLGRLLNFCESQFILCKTGVTIYLLELGNEVKQLVKNETSLIVSTELLLVSLPVELCP